MKPEMIPSSSSAMIKSTADAKENTTNTAGSGGAPCGTPQNHKSQIPNPCSVWGIPNPESHIPNPTGGLTAEQRVLDEAGAAGEDEEGDEAEEHQDRCQGQARGAAVGSGTLQNPARPRSRIPRKPQLPLMGRDHPNSRDLGSPGGVSRPGSSSCPGMDSQIWDKPCPLSRDAFPDLG